MLFYDCYSFITEVHTAKLSKLVSAQKIVLSCEKVKGTSVREFPHSSIRIIRNYQRLLLHMKSSGREKKKENWTKSDIFASA